MPLSDDERREARWGFWYGVRWLLLILFLLFVLGMIGRGLGWITADFRGASDAREKIHADGNFRIEAYDRFYNQCASVQSIEAAINAARAELNTKPSARRREQINTNITALTAARADAVNQYNADARKSYTAGQFKASDLPSSLPIEAPTEGTTSCGA